MKRMLVGTTITGRMYGICIGLQNWIVDRRHFLGGLQYFAVYKNGLVLCQGSLLFSRLQVNFQRRRKNVENQNSRLCCSKFLNCKACLQNEYRDFLRPGMMCQTSDITMLAETPAVSASNAENSTMVLQGKDLVSAIFYEAERGYTDAQGRTMRFSDFLYSRLLPLCFPSIHKSAKGLSEEVKNYSRVSTSDRLELLNKVSVLLGYDNIHALIGHERALRESSHGLQGNVDGRKEIVFSSCLSNGSVINPEDEVIGEIFSPDESDVLLACQKFPSIVLGSSPLVDLYIPTKEDFQRLEYPTIENSTEDSAMLPMDKNGSCIVTETQRTARDDSNQDASHLDLDAEQKIHTLKLDKQYLNLPILDTLETTKNAGLEEGTVMASTKLVSRKPSGKPEKTAIPVDSFLDAPIGTVRCVGPIQRRRLDENGFHTVRKLLHHFPRTYVNLQDAEGQIEDGQYLNFFGRILSSRGWKAGCSLGVHEVIVACQIHRVIGYCSESSQHDQNKPSKSTVYLHLKRFFRGARFTNIWILNKIQSKYHEGDLVSVSGKVKALEADDHFEIREFNLEVLDGEADLTRLDLYGKEKPCPVYPSKGTLDPKFIGDCIRRVLQVLHVEMDPVPDSFCKKYNLMGLCECRLTMESIVQRI
eukprot:Gb_06402 [translate_table: standard]